MKAIAQNYKTGQLEIFEVPKPSSERGVLVRTLYSVVSTGTESMKVREARMSLLSKARARPDKVREVLQSLRQMGLRATIRKIRNRLDSLTPLGYACVGEVMSAYKSPLGKAHDLAKGDWVACAGEGYATHAQMNAVPRNLLVKVPKTGVQLEQAAFTTIGAIAIQAANRVSFKTGQNKGQKKIETAVVIGQGLVGHLLMQILVARGIKVKPMDLAADRVALARKAGATWSGESPDAGPDVVFVAASSATSGPVELALDLVAPNGTIVIVGKSKVAVPYELAHQKQVTVTFSRSYGEGRYDSAYERGEKSLKGESTIQANMTEFMGLLEAKKLKLDLIMGDVVAFEEAPKIYRDLTAQKGQKLGQNKGLATVFQYGGTIEKMDSPPVDKAPDQLNLGVIGAGNYAGSMLLPVLKKMPAVALQKVVTTSGLNAKNAVNKFGFAAGSTNVEDILKDKDIDTVLIATPHKTHAELCVKALKSGKKVYIEKPLCETAAELSKIEAALKKVKSPKLMVGFNRRFSEALQALKAEVSGEVQHIHYRIQSGKGADFVGEAGHFIDVMIYLTGALPTSVKSERQKDGSLTCLFKFSDGSVGVLNYMKKGSSRASKEWIGVSAGQKTVRFSNFRRMIVLDGDQRHEKRFNGDKGQANMLAAWVDNPQAIPLDEILATTRYTIEAFDKAVSSNQGVT